MKKKYRLIDLFCGCGGLTQGFIETKRFKPVFANDNDAAALQSYRANFDPQGKHSVCQDVVELLETASDLIPQADVVGGGPPCQGFSLLNKKREGDKRRELWRYYVEIVRLSNARFVVMENVPQLIDSFEFTQILQELRNLGFGRIVGHVLNAANYGVPEIRKRAINFSLERQRRQTSDSYASFSRTYRASATVLRLRSPANLAHRCRRDLRSPRTLRHGNSFGRFPAVKPALRQNPNGDKFRTLPRGSPGRQSIRPAKKTSRYHAGLLAP